MRALPWILGGAAASVAAYYWQRDRHASSRARKDGHTGSLPPHQPTGEASSSEAASSSGTIGAQSEPLPGRWVWPVGVWHDRKPEISDGFSSKRRSPTGQLITHGGVDVM